MDGGTEWDVVQSWLEMADREDLLALLAYLGVDMGSLSQEELVTELYWTMERLPNSLVRAYRRYMELLRLYETSNSPPGLRPSG